MAPGVLCFIIKRKEDLKKLSDSMCEGVYFQAVRENNSTNCCFFSMIACQTLEAMENGSMIARKPEIDILLRLAGTTQINEAIREKGFKGGRDNVLILFGKSANVRKAAKRMKMKKLRRKRLKESELERIERAALLSGERFQASAIKAESNASL